MSSFACAWMALLASIMTSNASAREYVAGSNLPASQSLWQHSTAGDCVAAQAPCAPLPGWRGNFLRIQARDAGWSVPAPISGSVLAGLASQSHIEQALQLPAAAAGYTLSWSDGGCDGCAGRSRTGASSGPQHYRISFNGAVLAERIVGPGDGRQEHHLAFRASGPGLLRFERKGGGGTVLIDGVAVRDNMSVPAGGSALLVSLGVLMLGRRRRPTEKFTA
jgi:hypothetical protein